VTDPVTVRIKTGIFIFAELEAGFPEDMKKKCFTVLRRMILALKMPS